MESLDTATEGLKFHRVEYDKQFIAAASDDDGQDMTTYVENVGRGIVPMERRELDIKFLTTLPPLGLLAEKPMGDLAQ